jgi:hypothetical protein
MGRERWDRGCLVGIRHSRIVAAAAEAAHVSTEGRVFLAVQKTALLKTSKEAVLGCLSTAVQATAQRRLDKGEPTDEGNV